MFAASIPVLCGAALAAVMMTTHLAAAEPAQVLDLWPGMPPGEARELGPETDLTKPEDRLIAGRRIIKLGNVATPQLHVYLPLPGKQNGTAVVICPGGGFHILAWDLEGTEVAEWLNSIGVTAFVLKYRVPRRQANNSLMAVQDTQRALSVVRNRAAEWNLAPDRIGVLGFSAGGFAAAHAATQFEKRSYVAGDAADKLPFRPDFAVLIYAGGLIDDKSLQLKPEFVATKDAPPTFLVHALDDGVRCENSVQLFLSLKSAGVPGELHVYDAGGHGYGMRNDAKFPVTTWPQRCEDWFQRRGWLPSPE